MFTRKAFLFLLLSFVVLLQFPNCLFASIFGEGEASAIDIDSRYERGFMTVHSFKSPFFLVSGSISYWTIGGSAVITEDYVRLTSSEKSVWGSIWNSKPVSFSAWEVELQLKIGSPSNLGADGLGFWYVRNPGRSGSVFGGEDHWDGLAVLFDTFDNDGLGDNPYIGVYKNDGNRSYPNDKDGKPNELGGCKCYYRNYDFRVKITYVERTLQILTKISDDWNLCTKVNNVILRPGYYFGLTAATGGLSDNHDVYRFETSRLSLKGFQPPETNFQDEVQSKDPRYAAEQLETTKESAQRLDLLRRKLNNLKSEGTWEPRQYPPQRNTEPNHSPESQQQDQQPYQPPEDQQQQQQQPYQPPQDQQQQPEQQAIQWQHNSDQNTLNALFDAVNTMKATQDALQSTLSNVMRSVNEITNELLADSSKLEILTQQQQAISITLDELKRSSLNDAQRNPNPEANKQFLLQTFSEQWNELRRSLDAKLSLLSTGQQMESALKFLSDLKAHLEMTKEQQKSIEQSMRKSTEQISSTIESSSTFGFWSYFLIVQVVLGIAFMWWKKYRDETNKKLF